MIKKVILFIGVSTLFIVLFAQVNGMKASSKIGQDTADFDDWQQNKTNMKVHKGCNCNINWDSIHAIYAAKDYQLADEWQFRDFYVGSEDTIESGKRSVLWDMKIKLVGDSILYLNNKKVKVRRTNVDASAYKNKSYFDDYLVPFLAYRGINISKSVPVLQLTSSKEDVYSDDLRYIYTGNYIVLKYQGMCTIHKFIGKNSKSLPSPTAKLEYTSDDMFKDAVQVVVQMRKASTSLLQRKLRIGYSRAARIIEEMEEQGIIGPADGSRPREVLISSVDEISAGGDS